MTSQQDILLLKMFKYKKAADVVHSSLNLECLIHGKSFVTQLGCSFEVFISPSLIDVIHYLLILVRSELSNYYDAANLHPI